MSYFDYWANQSGIDDCYFETGDSGSPSFALSNGKPALVGTHSALFTDGTNSYSFNYDSFVPNYIPQLDERLAADGWRMTPSDPEPTALAARRSTFPSPLEPGTAGTATFWIKNTSRVEDGNVRVTLEFPTGTEPESIAGEGWFAESSGPLVWRFRRATLPARSSSGLTATWSAVPDLATLTPRLSLVSDGCEAQTQTFNFTSKRGR
jgi:hypothetical protein